MARRAQQGETAKGSQQRHTHTHRSWATDPSGPPETTSDQEAVSSSEAIKRSCLGGRPQATPTAPNASRRERAVRDRYRALTHTSHARNMAKDTDNAMSPSYLPRGQIARRTSGKA